MRHMDNDDRYWCNWKTDVKFLLPSNVYVVLELSEPLQDIILFRNKAKKNESKSGGMSERERQNMGDHADNPTESKNTCCPILHWCIWSPSGYSCTWDSVSIWEKVLTGIAHLPYLCQYLEALVWLGAFPHYLHGTLVVIDEATVNSQLTNLFITWSHHSQSDKRLLTQS